MDTQDMYARGIADAERGDPHPFYYQHYYHYRRGYDETRRRMFRPAAQLFNTGRRRMLIGLLVAVSLVVSGIFWTQANSPAATVVPTTTLPAVVSATPTPRRTPVFPTRTPLPTATPEPDALRVGAQVVITNTEGRPLRARADAGLESPVQAAFNEGEEVQIVEGPVESDGYIWWRLEGSAGTGWSAQQSLTGVIWLEPVP